MSFMGGAECSTAGNPLSQFTKHTQEDNSLQRDRLVNGGPQGSMGGFRSAPNHAPQDEMMNSFLQQNGRLHDMPPMDGAQLRMDHPSQGGVHLRANSASPSWTNEFQQNPQAAMESAFKVPPGTQFSPDDYAKFAQMQQVNQSHRSSPMPTQMGYQRPMMGGMGSMSNMGMGYGMGGMYGNQMYRPPQQQQPQQMDAKGKGKLVELDDKQWEEQFKQLELDDQKAREEAEQNAAMEPELNKLDEDILQSETNEFGDFESIWKGIQAEKAANQEILDEDEWVTKLTDDNWNNMNMNWGEGNGRLFADPQVENYLFEEDNLFNETGNPFEEGLRIMEEGGNLSLAALAFEAAVQKDRTHVEAWVQLGAAQAQNEKETAAIRALEQAKNLDPNNLPALMTLAVSYTNEGYDSTAYRTLERWLSIKYPSVISPADLSPATDLGFTDRQILHDKVTELFIKAANLSPDGEHMDPDVQVGLGVLFYGAEEYDKAVDCFSAALASSEQGLTNQSSQVHLLWNRLGATLANSGKSEDAIAAYEKALTLRPNFVRARYNLGVSCINMGCHAEAAGHLLAALEMHKSVETEGREKAKEILGGGVSDAQLDAMTTQNRSTNLYDTLRRVFTQMGRRDLAEKVVAGVDPGVFRGDIDF